METTEDISYHRFQLSEKENDMKKYLRHLSFRNGDGFDVEDWVNSDEFKNCELITITTYVNDDMDIVRELWYWFIAG